MASSPVRSTDRKSETDQPIESAELLFEGETLRISPQYLRRFLTWFAKRRD